MNQNTQEGMVGKYQARHGPWLVSEKHLGLEDLALGNTMVGIYHGQSGVEKMRCHSIFWLRHRSGGFFSAG